MSVLMFSNSIFSYDFDEFKVIFKKDVYSMSEKKVRDIVEDALFDVLEADPYYKAISHVYSNENNVPDFLITYLLRSDCLLYESYKISLDKNVRIIDIQKDFKKPSNKNDSVECYSCPDPEVEVYVDSPMDGAPLGAAEWVFSVALGAGYKTVKDIQANATAARFKAFITCPKIKAVVHVGHGNNEKGIMFATTDIQHPWFAALPNDYLVQQIHMYGSCLVQNPPFQTAILGTGVEAFMGGVTNIDITTLQNTMYAIAMGIFYGGEVKASFNNTDAVSNGWGITGNPAGGPWYVDIATPIINTVDNNISSPELICTYSNQLNTDMNITYSVTRDKNVRLDVYNTSGKLVENLVNETKQSGKYTMKWNVRERANGIYIFKLRVGNKEIVKRNMILK